MSDSAGELQAEMEECPIFPRPIIHVVEFRSYQRSPIFRRQAEEAYRNPFLLRKARSTNTHTSNLRSGVPFFYAVGFFFFAKKKGTPDRRLTHLSRQPPPSLRLSHLPIFQEKEPPLPTYPPSNVADSRPHVLDRLLSCAGTIL